MLENFLIVCDSCVKKEAIQQLTSIFVDLSIILNFVSIYLIYKQSI